MNKLVPPDDDVKSVRPASAPAHRVPFKPQFFWALRPEDVPDDMRSPKPGANYSPAYAHDPTSWLIHRPIVAGHEHKQLGSWLHVLSHCEGMLGLKVVANEKTGAMFVNDW